MVVDYTGKLLDFFVDIIPLYVLNVCCNSCFTYLVFEGQDAMLQHKPTEFLISFILEDAKFILE